MRNLENYKVIFWDFDGVILDSMSIRDEGFITVLKNYPEEELNELLTFHRANGGLSRYVKFRYFFEEIRKESVSEEQIQKMATDFSSVMFEKLSDEKLLIQDSLNYIRNHYRKKVMFIVSGSDQSELRVLCDQLDIAKYFKSIHGSPTPKDDLVKMLMARNNVLSHSAVLIGDSINDFEAAEKNGISFMGFNNRALKGCGENYIFNFHSI